MARPATEDVGRVEQNPGGIGPQTRATIDFPWSSPWQASTETRPIVEFSVSSNTAESTTYRKVLEFIRFAFMRKQISAACFSLAVVSYGVGF